jgi:hypothetical protein
MEPRKGKGAHLTVFIDDANLAYKNMKMNHMLADTTEELLDMARAIGVPVKWIQYPGNPKREHFDICSSKRKLAIKHGAVPVTYRELALMERDPKTGKLVSPTKEQSLLKR